MAHPPEHHVNPSRIDTEIVGVDFLLHRRVHDEPVNPRERRRHEPPQRAPRQGGEVEAPGHVRQPRLLDPYGLCASKCDSRIMREEHRRPAAPGGPGRLPARPPRRQAGPGDSSLQPASWLGAEKLPADLVEDRSEPLPRWFKINRGADHERTFADWLCRFSHFFEARCVPW